MLGAFWFPLLPPSIGFTPCGFLMRFAMTFHLGGPDIKTAFLSGAGEQVTLPPRRTCPEGAVKVQYY